MKCVYVSRSLDEERGTGHDGDDSRDGAERESARLASAGESTDGSGGDTVGGDVGGNASLETIRVDGDAGTVDAGGASAAGAGGVDADDGGAAFELAVAPADVLAVDDLGVRGRGGRTVSTRDGETGRPRGRTASGGAVVSEISGRDATYNWRK